MLEISHSVESYIIQHLYFCKDTERCCFWGASEKINAIDNVFYVESSSASRYYVNPDIAILNKKLNEWSANHIFCTGFVHSHITGKDTISEQDLKAAKLIFDSLHMQHMWLGLVLPNAPMDEILVFHAFFKGDNFAAERVPYIIT